MRRLLHIETQHVAPIKTLFEVLKEILSETTIEFVKDDEMMSKAVEDTTELSDAPDSDSDTDKKKKPPKSKAITTDGAEENFAGIKINELDGTNTLYISVKLNSKEFQVFKCRRQNHLVGVSLTHLYKYIKTVSNDDTLSIYINDDDQQNIIFDADNAEKQYKSNYKLKLLDTNKKKIKLPKTKFEARIVIDTTEFNKICKENAPISEYLEIKVTSKSVTFTCKGDCSERSTEYKTGDGDDVKVKIQLAKNVEVVQGIYELKFLNMFSRCNSLCNDIKVFMKNNYLLCIQYTVASLGTILFCLSPVVEDAIGRNFGDDEDLYEDEDVKYKC